MREIGWRSKRDSQPSESRIGKILINTWEVLRTMAAIGISHTESWSLFLAATKRGIKIVIKVLVVLL